LDDKAARAAAQQLIDPGQFPIAAALQQLREGLLRASSQEPCFDLVPAPSESPNTFAFGFTVINDASAGGELKFAVFSVGASTESQRTAGNTITVAFEAAGGSTMFR
jgi:hypothetical protein